MKLIALCSVCYALLYGDALADIPRQGSITIKEKNNTAEQWLDAAESGDLKTMKSLYKNHFFKDLIYKRNDAGKTALEIAITNGYGKMVEWLADRTDEQEDADGASSFNLKSKNKQHKPMMIIAAEKGYKDIVEIMLLRAMDPNIHTDMSGKTPLIVAAREGHIEVVELLLNGAGYKEADPNIKDDYGETALSIAAKNDHQDIVQLLLDSGANVSKRAITYAITNENEELESLLKKYKDEQDSKKLVNKIKNKIKGRKSRSIKSFNSDQTLVNDENSSIESDISEKKKNAAKQFFGKFKRNKTKTSNSEIEENYDEDETSESDKSLYFDAETDEEQSED